MKKILILLFSIVAFMMLPLSAQEKEGEEEAMPSMEPPAPLSDDFTSWMVGEWEGSSESPMGKFENWQRIEKVLDNQFLLIDYIGRMSSLTEEQIEKVATEMQMSKEDAENMMKNMIYKGHGVMTISPQGDEFIGYWFDSWRAIYKGTGTREGDKVTFTWEGDMGTSERTMERAGVDSMVETFKETMPSGEIMEGRAEWTRKK